MSPPLQADSLPAAEQSGNTLRIDGKLSFD